jgi:hypothetical protein
MGSGFQQIVRAQVTSRVKNTLDQDMIRVNGEQDQVSPKKRRRKPEPNSVAAGNRFGIRASERQQSRISRT